ncbi:TIM barrel protein [Thermovenabulum sp.]|uniref:TIM barrel protein n=1 Tax=Thermovenabulum sp. TaxID=3100335 RepID=UPI003C7C149D
MRISLSIAENVGLNFPVLLRGDITKNIKKAKHFGYDAIEIHIEDASLLNVEKIIESLNENKMTVTTLGTGLVYVKDKLSFTNPEKEIREKAVERINGHIKAAKILNAKVIIGSIRGIIPDIENFEMYKSFAIDCFKKCLENAEKYNVELVIEPLNRYETNFINNLEEALEIIEKIGSKFLKVHLDTFHMNIEEKDFKDAIILAKGKLGHIHFSDSNRKYPGSGHINFKEIVEALKYIDYKGAIAFEYLPVPDGEVAAERGINYIKNFL